MPQFTVVYTVEAEDESEALNGIPHEADHYSVHEKGKTFPQPPGGTPCVIHLGNERFVKGSVTGWNIGKPMFTKAQHLEFGKDEMSLTIHTDDIITQ